MNWSPRQLSIFHEEPIYHALFISQAIGYPLDNGFAQALNPPVTRTPTFWMLRWSLLIRSPRQLRVVNCQRMYLVV